MRLLNDLKYLGICILDISLINIAYIINKLKLTADEYFRKHSIQGICVSSVGFPDPRHTRTLPI